MSSRLTECIDSCVLLSFSDVLEFSVVMLMIFCGSINIAFMGRYSSMVLIMFFCMIFLRLLIFLEIS